MSGCEKCNGTGKVTCLKCGGNATVKCEKCNGHGDFRNCLQCDSTGKVDCPRCHGCGEEISTCPVCRVGKIEKTRWINCDKCHGKGYFIKDSGYEMKCYVCGGRGQVREVYKDICPNCHGEYKRKTGKPCKNCGGTGKTECSRCGGTGRAKCQECNGSGKVECDACNGEGETKCPDCKKREEELAKQKRRAENRENAAKYAAEERNASVLGCGCLLVLGVIVGLLNWWWMEGFAMSALPGMWEQTKKFVSGYGGVAIIVGILITLFIVWKVIKAVERKRRDSFSSSLP